VKLPVLVRIQLVLVRCYVGIFISDLWHEVWITKALSTCKDLGLLHLILF